MCNDSPTLRRRRSTAHDAMAQPSCTSNSNEVHDREPGFHVAGARSSHDVNGDRKGIVRSNTARVAITISTIALIILSVLSIKANRATKVKDLSDTVMKLTRQLQIKEDEKIRKLDALKKKLDDTETELAWERQHVEDQIMGQGEMYQGMVGQINREDKMMKEAEGMIGVLSERTHQTQYQLNEAKDENSLLKVKLALAIDHLENERSNLPAAPNSYQDQARKLRGVGQYQPGDNIEIVERQDDGTIAMHPGVISEANPDGTYNLVRLEESILMNSWPMADFQLYEIYKEGTRALHQVGKSSWVPITIVRIVPGSYRDLYAAVSGNYQFTLDSDKREPKQIFNDQAMRIHRLAREGEDVGTFT